MKVSELFAGQEYELRGEDVDIQHVAYDSRQVEQGSLFAALVGQQHDGHDHIDDAVSQGAAVVMCERPVSTQISVVQVENARRGLAEVARQLYGDPAAKLLMIGVTGTNGKTTTVHLLEKILNGAGHRSGIIGTLGARYVSDRGVVHTKTELTTPESLDLVELIADMAAANTSAVAMEVSSHALDQYRVAGLSFDVGVFTNLSHEHLDYHGTLDAYFSAKARLFSERLKDTGCAVLNVDDPRVRTLMNGSAIGFSASGESSDGIDARIVLRHAELSVDGMSLVVAFDGDELAVTSPLIGRFNIENILAAMAAAFATGIEPATIGRGVAALSAVPGRLERVSGDGQPLVLVDYAHTADALTKALEAAREVTEGKLICVFGCGGDRDVDKRQPMGEVAAHGADWVVVTNDNPRMEDPRDIAAAIEMGLRRAQPGADSSGFVIELDRAVAIERAIGAANQGDTVLIAGKGHEDYQIIGKEKRDFDDRVRARAALAAQQSAET